jgi:hypothetical protein
MDVAMDGCLQSEKWDDPHVGSTRSIQQGVVHNRSLRRGVTGGSVLEKRRLAKKHITTAKKHI